MAITRLRGPIAAGLLLLAVGCTQGQAGRNPAAARRSTNTVAVAVAGVPCAATTARPSSRLPAAFSPVAVVRCYPKARGIPGHGLWQFEVRQVAYHRLAAFVAALRRPSVRTPPSAICLTIGYLDPSFALVDRRGRIVRPTLPAGECGQPFAVAIDDLQRLPWVTVSVRRTVQLATQAELKAGCDPQWKDIIQMDSYVGDLQPSAGGPAFSPRPPRLRICIYQDRSNTFTRGGIIRQLAESKVLDGIQGSRTSILCPRPHTEYAVLLAVSPAYRGGQIAEAELGGCNRILRPDGRVGTVSPLALAIIRAAGRP